MSVSPVSQMFQTYSTRDVLQPNHGVAIQNPQLEKEQREKTQKVEQTTKQEAAQNNPRETEEKEQNRQTPQQLTEEEKRLLEELKARDREVRAHEAAHRAVGGQYVRGGISYTYQHGPDGNPYAIGGEVSIDASSVPGDPQATVEKAEQVKRAALAPVDPSAQDQAVAAQASQMASQARAEIQQQRGEEFQRGNDDQEETADSAQNAQSTGSDNPQVARYESVAALESDPSTEAALEFIA